MSRDVSLFRFSRDYASLEDVPADEQPHALGSSHDVHRAIAAVFPGTDWADPTWGVFASPLGSIEFNVGSDDPVQSLMLHVRANEGIVGGILQLCQAQGWTAIDSGDGAFLNKSPSPDSALRAWSEFLAQLPRQEED